MAALAGTSAAVAADQSASRQAVVVESVENMYSAPDPDKDVVSQALLGQVVGLLETRDGFARIETPDHYTGWVPASGLFEYADPKAPRYAAHGTVAEVTSLMANLYRAPDVTTARPRSQAPLGTRLEVTRSAEDPQKRWIAVRLPTGEPAWVQSGDVRVAEAEAPPPRGTEGDVVATARRFAGVPYLWGGMSAHGLDCSGLTSRAYAASGVVLPRDADMQFDDPHARPVERADLRPGDLVFFGQKKITHVGLYVGDGRFINATTHTRPDVHEESLDDPYWVALYRGGRRPQ
jgi:gamma-D-glutamyl-L-lysine dipeptidyl-peptidase